MATLEERIARTAEGQVTWANPDSGKFCTDCAHYTLVNPKTGGVYKDAKGCCLLCKVHGGKHGKAFVGSTAHSCSMFEERKHATR